MKKIDLVGKRFGKLVVIKPIITENKNRAWECVCDCGNTKVILGCNLTGGKSNSCGCARVDSMKKIMTTHGGSGTKLYSIFKGMFQRCYNEKNPAYHYYGGKGVKICSEWKDNFSNFREWSLLNGYNETNTIDRINPNGDYCPENCRWVSMQVQQNNKLNSAFLIIDGEKLTVSEWAEKNKTNKATLYSKIHRLLNQLLVSNATTVEIEIRTKREID